MGDVEIDAGIALFFHDGVDGAGGDIAGCEGAAGVVVFHEGFAFSVEELGAFAADGFGDEEGFGVGVIEAGGVELDEFHVADGEAGAPCHGDAVSCGDIGVGGVGIDFSETAGGQ